MLSVPRPCTRKPIAAAPIAVLALYGAVFGWSATPSAQGVQPWRLAFVQLANADAPAAGPEIANTILAGRYRIGMRIVIAERGHDLGKPRVVTEGFSCATDPAFSYDGKRLVFSGKRSREGPLEIWELVNDGAEPRQIFACDADCISPIYMPNGHIVFASLLAREYEEHGGRYSFSLYEWAAGSEAPTRLTFNPSSDFDPVVLPDGRLLYSAWQHVGNHHWPRGVIALMLLNADGTGIFPLTGNDRVPWLKRGARPFGENRIAFIQAADSANFGAGTLVATSLNDALAPYEILVADAKYQTTDVASSPTYPDGEMIFSARPTDGSRTTFGLYALANGKTRLLYDDPAFHELRPAVGAPTKQPELLASTVVPGTPHGYLVILNCYQTDRPAPLPHGSIGAVRVIEGLPLLHKGPAGPTFFSATGREDEPLVHPGSATGYIPSRILGEVPPAPDGSVYLKVPADRPLRLQLIDQEGFAVQNQRAWFWVRPNERRVCIGCHENRELSPANATPLAAKRKPTDLTQPSQWRTVSYRRDVQPILSANCAVSGCHVTPSAPFKLNMHATNLNGTNDAVMTDRFGPAYANLLLRQEGKPFAVGGRRVHPGDARGSPMLWMLYGRPLGPQYKAAPFDTPMLSPHPGPMLDEPQLEVIRRWVDVGAPYDDAVPPGPWPYAFPEAKSREASR